MGRMRAYKVYGVASVTNYGENARPVYVITATSAEAAIRTAIIKSDRTTTKDDWVVKEG